MLSDVLEPSDNAVDDGIGDVPTRSPQLRTLRPDGRSHTVEEVDDCVCTGVGESHHAIGQRGDELARNVYGLVHHIGDRMSETAQETADDPDTGVERLL